MFVVFVGNSRLNVELITDGFDDIHGRAVFFSLCIALLLFSSLSAQC